MVKNRFLGVIILILFLVVSGTTNLQLFINYNSNKYIKQELTKINNQNTGKIITRGFSSIKDSQEYKTDNHKKSWIIFASSKSEYDDLIKLPHLKSYPRLLAIKLNLTQIEATNYKQNHPNHIFSASLYTRARLINTKIESSSLYLDAIDDATIMNVKPLWDSGYNGSGVVIGVIDNGVDFNHEALKNQEFASKNFTISGSTIWYTHGTPVAGTIVANGINSDARGNAFGAKIAAANLGQTSDGFIVGDFLAAFDWLANMSEVKIINTSWSGGGEDVWFPLTQRLEQLGILVVGAAGNDGEKEFSIFGSPGNSIYGLSVGASSHDGKIATFSSEGPIGGGFNKPDVYAPGQSILTSMVGGSYGRISGTSFSSPLTAGAIATIISALNKNNISWNVGLLKAAIMRSANKENNTNELITGQGLVDANNALTMIMNAPKNNEGIPIITEGTPKLGLFDQLNKLRKDVNSTIPFTLISSSPKSVSFKINGNISQILSLPIINTSQYSQAIFMNANTYNTDEGIYKGNITIDSVFDVISLKIKLIVMSAPKFRVLFDLYHTTSDNGYTSYRAGYSTGYFIDTMIVQEGWVDLVNQPYTNELLSKYDLVWLPDPFRIDGTEPVTITDTETATLQNYVNNGGNLFINYFGSYTDPFATNGISRIGTNTTQLNQIIGNYGMHADDSAPNVIDLFLAQEKPTTASVSNQTSLGKSISKITSYESTKIIFNNSAFSISSDNTIIGFSKQNIGRVIVSSSDAWFANTDNSDIKFMINVFNWLVANPRIDNIEVKQNSENLSVFINTTQIINTTPEVVLLKNTYFDRKDISIVKLQSNYYKFDLKLNNDGIYQIQIAFSNDYQVVVFKIDNNPPSLSSENELQKNYLFNQSYEIEFLVKDTVDKLSKSDFIIILDDSKYNNFSYNPLINTLRINLITLNIGLGDHSFNISVSDNSNNQANLIYNFKIINQSTSEETTNLLPLIIIFGMVLITITAFIAKKKIQT